MFGLIATLSLVVVGAQSEAAFLHSFARNNMLPLAAAAYSDKPSECINSHFKDGKVVKSYKVDCSGPLGPFAVGKAYCSAYTALLKKENAIVLSFRGTDTFAQLLKEGTWFALSNKWFNGKAQVNTYFLSAFNSLWSKMSADVEKLIRDNRNYDIWITGHSLGGALASLAASHLLENGKAQKSKTKLMTFGQPRTGDDKFAKMLNDKIDYAFRVIHDNDGVPRIPPSVPNTPFGKLNYHHHKREVYYGRTMGNGIFKVCTNDEDCSHQFMPDKDFFGNVHKCYYGMYLSKWGAAGCRESLKYDECI